jgi:hypothetical protein
MALYEIMTLTAGNESLTRRDAEAQAENTPDNLIDIDQNEDPRKGSTIKNSDIGTMTDSADTLRVCSLGTS